MRPVHQCVRIVTRRGHWRHKRTGMPGASLEMAFDEVHQNLVRPLKEPCKDLVVSL